MIKKINNKCSQTAPALQKLKTMRKRINSAYKELIGYELNVYEIGFEMQKKEYELTPEELSTARKYGIWPSCYVVYDFNKWTPDQFLGERDYYRLSLWERGISPILVDKRNLPLLLQGVPYFLPSLNIAIDNGRVQYIYEDGKYQEGDFDLKHVLEVYKTKYKELLFKPHSQYLGKGIFSTSKLSLEDAVKRIENEKDGIINNILINEEYAHKINPSSLNTIRAIFFKTKSGSLKVFRMAHRFGLSPDSLIDNFSSGGGGAGIDVDTGELQQAFVLGKKRIDFDEHPVTGQKITGTMIPDWDTKLKQIDKLLDELKFLDFGGLDLAFTTEGLKLIEINRDPGIRLIQCSKPALLDEDFVEFLKIRGF
ncbi:MAG: hypothetical protein LHW44_01455 [Candidatus Cloacimonetes bacterium]|nr:hypothetical protein [Candidatus Cloacimonadota bacterium]